MAHELSIRENGFVEMAYTGEEPWHSLGNKLPNGASIEEWQKAAGMDWKIQRSKVRYAVERDGDALKFLEDDEHHVLFRSDTKANLAIVGSGFKVVQPHETLEFFRDLVASSGYELTTAGILHGGRKVWAQAEAGLCDIVVGNDLIEGKLLVATANDGSMKTIVKNVSERVVCANTLAIATGETGKQVKVSHRSVFDADVVKSKMGISVTAFHKFIMEARELAKRGVSPSEADVYVLDLLNADYIEAVAHDKTEVLQAMRENVGYRKILELFNGAGRGANLPGVKGTAWGLVNSVTEYVDHVRGNKGTTRDNRLDYAWFGAGDTLKTDAFNAAIELVTH